MSDKINESIFARIQQLQEKGAEVLATHEPNPPGFIGFATLDHGRFIEWRSSVENLIGRVAGDDSAYMRNFTKQVKDGHTSDVDAGIGILNALREDIELGFLRDVRELVSAEVFSDFLEVAEHLLSNGYKDPAASLIGAVLENGLKRLATENDIKVKTSDDIGAVNTKLADKEVYNRLMQKQVQAWKAIRDAADHGNFDEYDAQQVESMLKDVARFLSS